jgi:hypothetical protein
MVRRVAIALRVVVKRTGFAHRLTPTSASSITRSGQSLHDRHVDFRDVRHGSPRCQRT